MGGVIQLRFLILAVGIFFGLNLFAVDTGAKKDAQTTMGDKAYAKLKFAKAIRHYTNALEKGYDSIYLEQRIASSYKALNDQVNAEKIYAQLANNPKSANINKYYYAELLRVDKSYASARKYYEEYAKNATDVKNLNTAIEQMDRIPALSVENTAYKVYPLGINSGKADYAPVFYNDGKLIFSSDRDKKKGLFDKWAIGKFNYLYVTSLDSTSKPERIKLNPVPKSFESSAAFSPSNSLLIFSSESFKSKNTVFKDGKQLPVTSLYSAVMSGSQATNVAALSVNGDFSNTQPTITKDGKTLYFASDRLGGQGGTDIYVSTLNANGVWGDPQNLGDAVNTPYDEKYPFIADDGTLYFASNAPNGLGGLDIYKTTLANGQWSKPQNLGAPINSSYDDFSLIFDNVKKQGFFASNRPGGKGEDDIYRFTYSDEQPDYEVKIRVVDANTLKPIAAASLALDCQTATAANTLTDANGEKEFTITGGKTCNVSAWSPGYQNCSVDVSPVNGNGLLIISLLTDTSSTAPTALPASLTTTANTQVTNNSTAWNKALAAPGKLLEKGRSMYIPVSTNCGTETVTFMDLKTGFSNEIAAGEGGEVHFELQLNHTYAVTHGKITDTIATRGLRPGTQVIGGCTYQVGQMNIVPNIYYNVNMWNIRRDAAVQLDKLVTIMQKNPTLQIELSSNTDCRAGSRYNMVLSARRAKSAVDYLVKRGIKMQRMIAVGYGKTRLTNDCTCSEPNNYSPCTEAQHQANRRTEIKVLKY